MVSTAENKQGTDLVKIEEAAEILNMGMSTVYKLVSTKVLPSFRYGRTIRIRREDLEKFIAEHYISRRSWE
jgi:excisionase family DNA binding protein